MNLDLRLLWDFQDPIASRQRFEALLDHEDQCLVWEVRAQIARTFSLTGEYQAAIAILESLRQENLSESPRAQAAFWLEAGRCHHHLGEKTEAQKYFELAANSPIEDLKIDALHMLAMLGSTENALEVNQMALELAMNSTDEKSRRWAGSLLNNIGWNQFELGQLDKALASFEHALNERKVSGNEFQIHVANWCVARCLRELGRVEEALEIQRSLDQSDPYVLEEIQILTKQQSP